MNKSKILSSDDFYYYIKNHFERWIDRYNSVSRELCYEQEREDIEFNKYVSNERDIFFMENYQDSVDEYYDYIEKTLLELRTQKR